MDFIITHNLIDGKVPIDRTEYEKKQFPFYFQLFDDDDEMYFKGYAVDGETEQAFVPLDTVGAAYGCTYIKYRNKKTGKMEIL